MILRSKTLYVLVQPGTTASGRPRYFRAMTSMGPACTLQLRDAAKFPTEQAARQSPACGHKDIALVPLEVKR